MKKFKIFAIIAAILALCLALGSCNGGNEDNKENGGDKNKITLTVWGAEEDQEMLKAMCAAYAKANPDKEYKFLFGVQSEKDAADKIVNDVTSGPDVFSFPSDQLYRLYSSGALARVGGAIETNIKEINSAGSIDAATIKINGEDQLFAYPCTEDNTLFLYYDKSVIDGDDITTLDALLEAAQAAGRTVHFKLNDDGWYLSSFFFAIDELGYNVTYDDKMVETAVDINYNNSQGLEVMKALRKYINHPALVIQTDDSKIIAGFTPNAEGAIEVAAGVSGTWNAQSIKELLGDNMGVAKLPTVEIGGEQKQLTTYMGCKLIGVNGFSQNKAEAHKLAQWLTNEQNQVIRFETRGFAPTNKVVAASDAVKNDPVISAVMAQAQYSRAQKGVPSQYWTPMGELVTPFIAMKEQNTLADLPDSTLQEYLDSLVAQIAKEAQ